MTTGKTIALTIWTFVSKVMSLLFNILSRLIIVFHPVFSFHGCSHRPQWFWSLNKIRHRFHFPPSICHEVMGPDATFLVFLYVWLSHMLSFPGGATGKEPTCQCRRRGISPWVRRSPGGGYRNPVQYSWLEKQRDRGAGQVYTGSQRVGHSAVARMHALAV